MDQVLGLSRGLPTQFGRKTYYPSQPGRAREDSYTTLGRQPGAVTLYWRLFNYTDHTSPHKEQIIITHRNIGIIFTLRKQVNFRQSTLALNYLHLLSAALIYHYFLENLESFKSSVSSLRDHYISKISKSGGVSNGEETLP